MDRRSGWPRLVFIAAVLGASVLPAACGTPQAGTPDVTVEWSLNPDRPHVGHSSVSVTLADSTGAALRGADVTIEGLMTHPGMSPVIADAREAAPGRYVADLNFTMRGDWILILEATLADGRTIHERKELPGVGAR